MTTCTLTRKVSYPRISKCEHDFRKEFKGSILEKKFRRAEKKESRLQSTLKTFADWFLPKKRVTEPVVGPLEQVPNEILYHVLSFVDEKSTTSCRRVCKRWNQTVDYIEQKRNQKPKLTISRLIISSSRKGLELRRCSYDTQKAFLMVIPWSHVNNFVDFGYSFSRFNIQRIIIKDLVLTDIFVDFIRQQLAWSDLTELCHFSLHKVDFSEANSLTLHKLLAPMAKKIEFLETTQCYGMRADSLTDSHLAQLDASRLRKVHIDGVRFAALRKESALKIGNSSLKHFSDVGNYPVLVLDRCSVTTEAVCRYTQQWLEHLDSEETICTPVCTVKRCIYVDCNEFEEACKRRGLKFRHRRGSGSMTMYSVQNTRGQRHSLSLQIAPPEKEEDLPKKKDL